MPFNMILALSLENRDGESVVDLGKWDVTLAVLDAIQHGQIGQWSKGPIPASVALCLDVSHQVRLAAWNNSLYIRSGYHRLADFVSRVSAHPNIDSLIAQIDTIKSARAIRLHAERLLMLVEHSRTSNHAKTGYAHPLTGKVDNDPPDRLVPFRFASMKGRWKGVKSKELIEFTKVRQGVDARAFLDTVLFTENLDAVDVGYLDQAVLRLAKTGDFSNFNKMIEDWNARQKIDVQFANLEVVVTAPNLGGYETAHGWCEEYLRSAIQLEEGLKELYSENKVD